jgi:EpsI family protein
LKLTDYLLANYRNGRDSINLYLAYYASQRKGQSVHSPRSCLPGGGWQMTNLQRIPVLKEQELDLTVNRAEIQWHTDKQIVYSWFNQRGRQLTNEYLVKWYLLLDALTRNRSDGALVRLITPIKPGEEMAMGDRRLQTFAAEIFPRLNPYIPR